ncbi:transposase [Marispirochaeta sp.]|uniref:transposase n=1 Tax=Marispirochaeta sp. TaxID=2038653 RepID=UPI003749C4F4
MSEEKKKRIENINRKVKRIDAFLKNNTKKMGIIEPVFGNITSCKRLDRFTLRTKAKANVKWVLYCMIHNIGKIRNTMVPDPG